MAYTPQSWSNSPATTTPISAARLGYIESGIQTAAAIADTNATAIAALPATGNVAKVGGIAITGTPTVGQVPTATSGTAATWQTPAGGGGGGYVDPLTTAGDIVVRGASTTVRKAIGTQGQVFRVNTANADKTEWATVDGDPLTRATSLVFALVLGT